MKRFILLILLSTFISSCTYRWYREFLPDENLSKQETFGWVFEPRLYAYKNIAGDNPPLHPNRFSYDIWAKNNNQKKKFVKDLFVDQTIITLFPSEVKIRRNTKSSNYVSFSSEKNLTNTFGFESLIIEENVDSLKVAFNAKIYNARLSICYWDGIDDIKFDTVIVSDTTDYEIVPIEFMMYRHESKTKIPAFFKSM